MHDNLTFTMYSDFDLFCEMHGMGVQLTSPEIMFCKYNLNTTDLLDYINYVNTRTINEYGDISIIKFDSFTFEAISILYSCMVEFMELRLRVVKKYEGDYINTEKVIEKITTMAINIVETGELYVPYNHLLLEYIIDYLELKHDIINLELEPDENIVKSIADVLANSHEINGEESQCFIRGEIYYVKIFEDGDSSV